MDDVILQQLGKFTSKGINVRLISPDTFQVAGLGTWFYVGVKVLETAASSGHVREPYEPHELAEKLVSRFHHNWQEDVLNRNIYVRPEDSWCQLFQEFNLPHKLTLV